MRCAGYAKRKSCADDRIDVPIKEQNDRIREYCVKNSHTLVSLYEDKSDDVMRDGGFLKLKTDGMMRKFDFVIVDSIYRCGMTVSNARDLLQMVFYPAGIGFVVLEDGFCSIGKSDKEMDEYFVNAIRLACLKPFADKRRNDWEKGIFSVHDEKYGYLLADDMKSFSIDEEAAPIIQEIFELADSGKKMTEITDYLNEQGYESYGSHLKRVARKNKPQISAVWTVGAVKTILHTTSYKGKGTRNLDGVTYEYDIPAIVTPEMYDGVQEKLAARHPKIRKKTVRMKNAFTGRIIDAETGNNIVCSRLEDTGEPVFPERSWRPERYVRYADVMEAVKMALDSERIACDTAERFFGTYTCERYVSDLCDDLYNKGVEAFGRIVEVQRGNIPLFQSYERGEISKEEYDKRHQKILDNIRIKTADLDALMEEEKLLRTKYSRNNPWMKLYGNIKVPRQLDGVTVRKYVEKIVLHDFREIEVRLKKQEWRIEPENVTGGSRNGKKEQKEN